MKWKNSDYLTLADMGWTKAKAIRVADGNGVTLRFVLNVLRKEVLRRRKCGEKLRVKT